MDAQLQIAAWPNDIDPHRCGTAPFVPDVSGPVQNSCGSYKAGFGENGCNKYKPNYPDDRWLEKNGCEGLKDCYNGNTPDVPRPEPSTPNWPAEGYVPQRGGKCVDCNDCGPSSGNVLFEGFASDGCTGMVIRGGLWIFALYFVLKFFFGRKR